jgi:short-subunit dehydrogenase
VKVSILALDLSKQESPEAIYAYTKEHNIIPDYLINNAGFGGYGEFWAQEWEKHANMIQLNIISLTRLTYLYLPDMIKN